jgi:2,4-dienoyl-CoA reductase-like NADH-dependent reductase (Old Yellow Enzyme family)
MFRDKMIQYRSIPQRSIPADTTGALAQEKCFMAILFESTVINGMSLANRFVRSATWEGMATKDGACTSQLTDTMVKLAQGGVGLIISGHGYVSREGQASPWQLGIHEDSTLNELTEMTAAVHRCGGKIAMQIAHGGGQAAAASLAGLELIGPSMILENGKVICREMSKDDIDRIVCAFGDAAARTKRSGFDAVEIHAAHGYLLSQFLSPAVNQRTDEYGGALANRGRIVLEVLHSVRAAVGSDYPVLIKFNSEDFVEGGFSVEDMLELSALLEKAGIDAIELSGGTGSEASKYKAVRFGTISKENEVYYRDAARRFKQRVQVPLILVGGIRSLDVAEGVVADGTADYIALSRPLICEPDLVNRWKNGDTTKSACVSDNRCFNPARAGEGLRCVLGEKSLKSAKAQHR